MADRRSLLSCALLAGLYVPALGIGFWSPGHDARDASAVPADSIAAATSSPGASERLAELRAERKARIWQELSQERPWRRAEAPEAAPEQTASPRPADSPPPEQSEPPAAAETAPPADDRFAAASAPPAGVLDENQVIVYYGTPAAAGLGVLGTYSPEQAALQVKEHAALYDSLNGDRRAIGAFDLIYSLAQADATGNGMYIRDLPDRVVEEYIAVAERYDLQLILDLQIGRANIPSEVRRIERFLLNPRVHVAVDPEYAVGPNGVPIATPGRITGAEINEVQDYLSDLVARNNLPPKMFIMHQFMDGTFVDGEVTRDVPNVDLVLNMDAYGDVAGKVKKYQRYADRAYAEHDAFNIFLKQDERSISAEEILRLVPEPHMVFYQ